MFSLPKGKRIDLYIECGADACDDAGPSALARQRRRRPGWPCARRRRRGASPAQPAQSAVQRLAGPVARRPGPADHRPADRPLSLCRHPLVLDPVRARRHHHRLADAVARPVAGQGRADLSGRRARRPRSRAFRDSAPGKIMHETRGGEMSALRRGAVRPLLRRRRHHRLFVALAGAYAERTGDLELIRDALARPDRAPPTGCATTATPTATA